MIKHLATVVIKDIKSVFSQLKTEGVVQTFRHLNSHDAPGTVQFVKYGICGVIAVVVLFIVTEIASYALDLPFDREVSAEVTPAEAKLAERNLIICSTIAFPFSNLAAYITNVLWVFTPGKHSRWKEFSLFTGVALFAFVVGMVGGPIMVSKGLHPRIAQMGLIVTSAMVNYVCRKLIIFMK